MRNYDLDHNLEKVFCNQCKKELKVEKGIIKEGCFQGDTVWNYFSGQDGARHRFDFCEACYLRKIRAFQIPVTEEEETELL